LKTTLTAGGETKNRVQNVLTILNHVRHNRQFFRLRLFMWYACLVDVRFAGASRTQGRLRAVRCSQQQLPELEHGAAVERGERPQRAVPSGSRYNLGQSTTLCSLGLRLLPSLC